MSAITPPNTDRLGLAILSTEESWELLAASAVGRVAFVDAGEPLILPVTHALHGHSIVFRSDRGTKLEAAEMAHAVAFEVDDWDRDARRGWSVLCRGVAGTVYDDAEIEELEGLGLDTWLGAAEHGTWVRIRVDEISGRRIDGADPAPVRP